MNGLNLQNYQAQLEEAKIQQQINALEELIKSRMTKEALQRYGNIKIAYPEKAVQVLVIISQAMQEGKIKTITDETLKNLLRQLSPEKNQFRIIKK